ncbi:DEAD/DEAH box helicase [Corynebacterium freneyi]|uniref:Superfamily II DNA or RNA helicase n=1 Tax=Corynebacterium freneyi TaxID=134034 RepID=A0ABS4U701_9CORY|nr:DEAD/DEAH box helicase [Corynebacterium freneyi]MBP2332415.1 superfamily II DNA or RNA helicase [Corynebacterium freneyi]QXA53394.1 DEAD/DEAH box helicase [Corynebacterium freneyi]WJZ05479.1 ATP-dependent helicase HepA [Corynebacterium freneyi]
MNAPAARESIDLVRRWSGQAARVLDGRARIAASAGQAASELCSRTVPVKIDGEVAWRVLPVDGAALLRSGEIVRHRWLAGIGVEEARLVEELAGPAATAVRETWAAEGWRRFFSRAEARATADRAVAYLRDVVERVRRRDVPTLLDRLEQEAAGAAPQLVPTDLMYPDVGVMAVLSDGLPDDLGEPELVSGADVAALPGALSTLSGALEAERTARLAAIAAGERLRTVATDELLAGLDVSALRDVTRDRLRIAPIEEAGLHTVGAVLRAGASLTEVPGIGADSARKLLGAAQTLRQQTMDDQPLHLDPAQPTPQATDVLRALRRWEITRGPLRGPDGSAAAVALGALAPVMAPGVGDVMVFPTPGHGIPEFRGAVARVLRLARALGGAVGKQVGADAAAADEDAGVAPDAPDDELWADFRARPADYQALAAQLGLLPDDGDRVHGDLPEEIVAAIRGMDLDTGYLKASLRGYQDFAARFALVQGKVLIGDEMGLGKTIEALAALTHLHARDKTHFLVVCPAAVVSNWMREIESKSRLEAHRLHGQARDLAVDEWLVRGGVAVTTYGTLAAVRDRVLACPGLACVVVDEAHYIKNPGAKRSQLLAEVIGQVDGAILLTGTALENRIDEFRTLVRYLRPDLLEGEAELPAAKFRELVAPVYLRRNQADVLDELPALVEVDDWVEATDADEAAYRTAVDEGNFMAMRRAAFAAGAGSAKMERLVDIAGEARDNGRRVIVFSHFRDVLDAVMGELGEVAVGPLTGDVPAARRQELVDEFSAADGGAVLVSQIVAGGVGLNIQAASVVVICEPQLKPTTEWQAIARAHRMGQLESVQVHRLLLEDSVDARIVEILARKMQLFDELVRVSTTADAAPEAYDVSEAELAREIIAAERERLAGETPANPPRPAD